MQSLEGEYIYQEICEQPALVRRRASRAVPPWPAAAGRTILTGAGDSLAAAELVAALYPELAITALPAMEASAAALRLGRGDMLMGISVSGRTPRVVEAALRARSRGAGVIAVTDDPGAALAQHAHEVWPIEASPPGALQATGYASAEAQEYVGYHHDVAQTKSFVAVLLTLAQCAEGSSGATDWERLAATVDGLVHTEFIAPIAQRVERWTDVGQTFCLGCGPGRAVARFAAYKLFEFNRLAHVAELEEYCHTHYFVTRPGDVVVFVVHDVDTARRTGEIAPVLAELFGAHLVVVRPDDVAAAPGTGDEIVTPAGGSAFERHIGLVLAVEWLTYLWGRIGAPDINTFHAGFDTERLVGASMQTIRRSRVDPGPGSA